jgi:RNA polymerase sigma-70 factor (ECF subfamily)
LDDARTIRFAWSPDADDAELAHAASLDRAAFMAIYERHRAPVYRYLRARTTTDADAQDLTAITFERAMGAIHRFRPVGGGMAAWLIRIARNAHADDRRKQQRRGAEILADADLPVVNPSDDTVILRSMIDALPDAQRDAIQMRFAAGLTAREIGSLLGVSEAAAQKQIERGLAALKEAYGDD